MNECHIGECREVMRELIADGVRAQMCVTSPPYWGLRDYGVAGQLGLETTPQEYVANMVEVFRLVREMLADDGALWLNLGDTYAADRGNTAAKPGFDNKAASGYADLAIRKHNIVGCDGVLKAKDLVGIPWRVAFALQADGWYLRQDIIWAKPNPMPESVRDRCTKSHEYLFLLAKGKWTGAVEPIACSDINAAWLAALIDGEGSVGIGPTSGGGFQCHIHIANTNRALLDNVVRVTGIGRIGDSGKGKNWPVYRWQVVGPQAAAVLYRVRGFLIAKQRQADNAIALQESQRRYGGNKKPDAVKAFQAELHARGKALNKGHIIDVPTPNAAWSGGTYYYDAASIAEESIYNAGEGGHQRFGAPGGKAEIEYGAQVSGEIWNSKGTRNKRSVWTIATRPYSEAHFATFPPALIEPCILAGSRPGDVVLDPFFGSGTTGEVCERLGRKWIGIELNPAYAPLQRARTAQTGLELRT